MLVNHKQRHGVSLGRYLAAVAICLAQAGWCATDSITMRAFPPPGPEMRYQVTVEALLKAGPKATLVSTSKSTLSQKVQPLQGADMSRVLLESRDMVLETKQGDQTQREFPKNYQLELIGDGQRYYLKQSVDSQAPGMQDTVRTFLAKAPAAREVTLGAQWQEEGEINLPELGCVPVTVTYRCDKVKTYRGHKCVVIAGKVAPGAHAQLRPEVDALKIAGEAAVYYDVEHNLVVDTIGKVDITGKLKSGHDFHGQMTSKVALAGETGALPVTSGAGWVGPTLKWMIWGLTGLRLAWLLAWLPMWRTTLWRKRGLRLVAVTVALALMAAAVYPLLQTPSAQADTAANRGIWLGGALGYFLHTMGATMVLATSYTTFGLTSYCLSVFPGGVLYFGEPGFRFYMERAERHFAMVIERGHYSALTDEVVHSPSVLDILGHETDSVAEAATDFSYTSLLTSGNFVVDRGEFLLFGALDLWEDLWVGNIAYPGAGYYRIGSASENLDAQRRTGRALAAPPVTVNGFPQ